MTPREKAEELFDKYFLKMENGIDENGAWICIALNKGMAKGCAIIAVEEILKITWVDKFLTVQEYYLEVKQEIQKL